MEDKRVSSQRGDDHDGAPDVAVDAVGAVVGRFLSQLVSLVDERLHLFQLFSPRA